MKKIVWVLLLGAGCSGRIVPDGAGLELLWNEGTFTEGGAVDAQGRVLFSDIGDRLMRYDPKSEKTEVFRQPSGKGNGMAFDVQGRLLVCEGGARRVSITDATGTRTLCDRFEGKRFNSPNDLVVDRRGRVYFTDPRYGSQDGRELDFEGVFLVTPDGKVALATRALQRPNGIQLSPDGKTLYVADNHSDASGNHHLTAFEVAEDGSLSGKRILHDFGPDARGIDGMKVDVEGNLYATAGTGAKAGVYIFTPEGKPLDILFMPGDPTNCVFDGTTLYITAQSPNKRWSLYRVRLTIPGHRIFP
jgi:sugar lactone lactonase YvrE